MYFHVLFILRRLLTVVILLFFDNPSYSAHLTNLMCLLQLCYLLHVKPFNNIARRRIELYNEFMTFSVCYGFVCLGSISVMGVWIRDPESGERVLTIGDPKLETNISWVIIYAFVTLVVVNLLVILITSSRPFVLRYRRRQLRLEKRRMRIKKQQEQEKIRQ